MKSSKSGRASFDPAQLPDGLRERGRPLSVHRPWGQVIEDAQRRVLARLFGENWGNFGSGPAFERATLFALGGLFFCGSLVALGFFFFRPPTNEDSRWVLAVAGIALVLSAVGFGLGLFYYRLKGLETRMAARPGKLRADTPDLYLVYKDGLAAVSGDRFEFMEWAAVEEVAWTWIRLGRQLALTDADGRQLVVWQEGYTEAGELRLAIFQRVNDVLLPRTLQKLAAGKAVKFGPFTLSRGGLKYKGRKARWDDITSLKLHTHRGDTRLTIYVSGRLLAWSWCSVDTIPNWNTFYDALCKTAPESLLTTSTRPRW
jgi:hypothetical protein